MKGPRWTEAHDTELARLRAAGLAHADIAERMGRSEKAVEHRAWVLGLAKPQPVRLPGVRTGITRLCMCCRRGFQSAGSHNRLCNDCRARDAGVPLLTIHHPQET